MSSPLRQKMYPNADVGNRAPAPVRRRAVMLINLGTPDRPDVPSVRRYLTQFLSDPSVIRLPVSLGFLNRPLGTLIARFRAPASAAMYQRIWSKEGSPLRTITLDQVADLKAALPPGWQVFYAMRYGRPGIVKTLRSIEAAGVDELVVVPMYPQYSDPTTGTALRLVYDYLQRPNHRINVTVRTAWHDDHGYINAQAGLLEQYAASHGLRPDNTFLLFSTHGLPVSYARRGDPYPQHVARTVALVANRLGWPMDRTSLAYQSRFGPVEWLRPYTDHVLTDLARAGEKRVLVCPVSFTADCLETLEEIDLRYRELFEKAGGELYLAPALNNYQPFISALKHLVLRGPQPVRDAVPAVRLAESRRPGPDSPGDDLERFLMVGVSTRGRLEPAQGPVLAYTAPEDLHRIKCSQCEVPALLERIRREASVREGWIFNTCHRFEFYGWTDGSGSARARRESVASIQRLLLGDREPSGLAFNVLFGAEARHHLIRSSAGLNSRLPAERDILEQLKAAHRLASCGGSAGPLTDTMMADVLDVLERLRNATAWGRYGTDYTFAALSQIAGAADLDLPSSRIAVLGGSTTSAGALQTLIDRFHVPSRQLTLIYRGHKRGGQIKLLRKAIGSGRRIRVQSYYERRVADAIAEADVVVLGVDREEPVLTGDALASLRDWSSRPLTIFDFNVFGSTEGVGALPGVRVYAASELEAQVDAFAEKRCATGAFRQAVDEAEAWILRSPMTAATASADPGIQGHGVIAAADRSHSPGLRPRRTCHSGSSIEAFTGGVDETAPAGVEGGAS